MNSLVKFVDSAVKEFIPEKSGFKRSASDKLQSEDKPIWDVREHEPEYAKLKTQTAAEKARALNVYDQPIDLIRLVEESEEHESATAGQSLFINGNPAVGDNPNRNKQHGFYFTADNCIGCHACESACAEKNETPAHLAFRSVGYVEGGSFPDFQRMNISMACNHCDDPVCLKGCPTLAYTKHTEYGAVLQDPDTCFGCGYCTWVCPYNAPQLDPVKGQVSKCNMCVDRLEEGLKPACVSACVGNALDFGVIEDIPEQREQAKTSIPGFPDPTITQPNIRFQQKAGLPEEMSRTDSAPLKYRFDSTSQRYAPVVDEKYGRKKFWNLGKLNSSENPLVFFTLLSQAGMGLFLIYFSAALLLGPTAFSAGAHAWVAFIAIALNGLGLVFSTTHLGKPMRFYRGFNNLRHSPVSREAFGVSCFEIFAGCYWLVCLFPDSLFTKAILLFLGLAASASASAGLFYMVKCYRIPARPFWNHWQTATAFLSATLGIGGLLLALIVSQTESGFDLRVCAALVLLSLIIKSIGLYFHGDHNNEARHEGAASHYLQTTEYGKTYWFRNGLIVVAALLAVSLVFLPMTGGVALLAWCLLAVTLVASQLISRAMFYVLVIPTTMPGAFFWRNEGFANHAKSVGLHEVVDMGLVSSKH